MDPYLLCLLVGGGGLALMAVTGVSHHAGGHGHGGHSGHGVGHGHGGHGHSGHGGHAPSAGVGAATWLLMFPRFMFAGMLGFGAVGLMLRTWFGGALLFGLAIAGAIVIERLIVNPLWNLAFRFASNPATTLEGAIECEAVAVSNFDGNGQGIIAVEVDGHVQQVLATLRAPDRAAGARVRSGQRVRIESVDSGRQRCTVTLL